MKRGLWIAELSCLVIAIGLIIAEIILPFPQFYFAGLVGAIFCLIAWGISVVRQDLKL